MRVILSGVVSVCLSGRALGAAWPADSDWTPLEVGGAPLSDPSDDQAGGASTDLSGDEVIAAAWWFVDAERLWFRLHLAGDPSLDKHVAWEEWAVLIDTDGDTGGFELSVVLHTYGETLEVFTYDDEAGATDWVSGGRTGWVSWGTPTNTGHARTGTASDGGSWLDLGLDLADLLDSETFLATTSLRLAAASAEGARASEVGPSDLAGSEGTTGLAAVWSDPVAIDADGDSLVLFDELRLYGTDPDDPDTDGDSLSDQDEICGYETDPNDDDTDGDELNDGAEVAAGTDPLVADSDGDGLEDGPELLRGCDPAVADSDADGVLDVDERAADSDEDTLPDCLDPDDDGDGIPTEVEGAVDTDGDLRPDYVDDDSDGDGTADAVEGTGDDDCDALPNYVDPDDVDGPCADPDGDGLVNSYEESCGSDPSTWDECPEPQVVLEARSAEDPHLDAWFCGSAGGAPAAVLALLAGLLALSRRRAGVAALLALVPLVGRAETVWWAGDPAPTEQWPPPPEGVQHASARWLCLGRAEAYAVVVVGPALARALGGLDEADGEERALEALEGSWERLPAPGEDPLPRLRAMALAGFAAHRIGADVRPDLFVEVGQARYPAAWVRAMGLDPQWVPDEAVIPEWPQREAWGELHARLVSLAAPLDGLPEGWWLDERPAPPSAWPGEHVATDGRLACSFRVDLDGRLSGLAEVTDADAAAWARGGGPPALRGALAVASDGEPTWLAWREGGEVQVLPVAADGGPWAPPPAEQPAPRSGSWLRGQAAVGMGLVSGLGDQLRQDDLRFREPDQRLLVPVEATVEAARGWLVLRVGASAGAMVNGQWIYLTREEQEAGGRWGFGGHGAVLARNAVLGGGLSVGAWWPGRATTGGLLVAPLPGSPFELELRVGANVRTDGRAEPAVEALLRTDLAGWR